MKQNGPFEIRIGKCFKDIDDGDKRQIQFMPIYSQAFEKLDIYKLITLINSEEMSEVVVTKEKAA